MQKLLAAAYLSRYPTKSDDKRSLSSFFAIAILLQTNSIAFVYDNK
ncbi:MAG: hypothetical protein HC941_14385 [Microcoleus sp. SU_5_3]|nr:hypothetical protein [Microcoleus sp. SU_5_3]